MKRVILAFPFTALLFFYACGPITISPAIGTAVAQTQTATMWTPTITPTFNPDLSKIKDLLNKGFEADKLEMTLDARYTAFDIWLPYLSNNSRVLHLDVHCVCAINSHCCTPERTFVVTIQAMKIHAEEILAQVPEYITRVDVACHNDAGTHGVMGAPWSGVKAYLLDDIDGSSLGWRVTPDPVP